MSEVEGQRAGMSRRAWLPVATVGLRLVFRRKLTWGLLVMGLGNFLFFSAVVYLFAQLEAEVFTRQRWLRGLTQNFAFAGTGESYRQFILLQNIVLMFFLGFTGMLLIGGDFRRGAVAFYLSKPIRRFDYLLGKLAAATALGLLLTALPGLVLWLEFGLFGDGMGYFRESLRVPFAIVGYGLLVSFTTATLLLGVCSALQKTVPVLCAWGAIFVFLPLVASILRHMRPGRDAWQFALADVWAIQRWISGIFFGHATDVYAPRMWAAVPILLAVQGACLLLFWRRVRAVEVVT